MKTKLCQMLGIEHPIIAAPMGPDLTGPDLVAAVSNAGGLGILQAQFCTPPVFRQEIRRVRALTARPFGVNLLLHFPVEDQVAICLEERVPVLSLFWGDPTPYVGRAHAAGVKVFHQVGSVADARRAATSHVPTYWMLHHFRYRTLPNVQWTDLTRSSYLQLTNG